MITLDIQKLDAGEMVQLFELDLTTLGGDYLRFHPHTESGFITFQGKEYTPWALNVDGFAKVSNGSQPSPTLTLSNIDNEGRVGIISSLCIALDDIVGARLIRLRTFAKYLDNGSEPNHNEHLPPEVWLVEQKTEEMAETVTFELASALDFNGQQLPANQIIANSCLALRKGGYRGYWCGYTGGRYFDKDGNPVQNIEQDRCGGKVSDCKKRFGEYEIINFVGGPSADGTRRY